MTVVGVVAMLAAVVLPGALALAVFVAFSKPRPLPKDEEVTQNIRPPGRPS